MNQYSKQNWEISEVVNGVVASRCIYSPVYTLALNYSEQDLVHAHQMVRSGHVVSRGLLH